MCEASRRHSPQTTRHTRPCPNPHAADDSPLVEEHCAGFMNIRENRRYSVTLKSASSVSVSCSILLGDVPSEHVIRNITARRDEVVL